MDAREVGRRVRAARAYAGLGRDELAKTIGLSGNTLGRLERGDRDARPMELWAIADTCRVPREWFTREDWGRGEPT